MAGGIELAKAYVQIIPSTEGIGSKLKSALGSGDITSAASSAGKNIGTNVSTGLEKSGVQDEANSLGQRVGQKLSAGFSVVGSAMATVAKSALSAVGSLLQSGMAAAWEGIKASVSNYANYEQLTGGVKKLYGDAYDTVMNYADSAYKTMQMSANDYMDISTSFAATLIKGLGGDTQKAAEYANKAVGLMADNVNAFGTDMASVQYAFQGFAKGNYTMLDNLKLGYAGTQQGMIDLINDSGILNEKITSLDNITFDQMIDAIGVIQEQLGIAGTTANEAGTTIEGSMNSARALLENVSNKIGSALAPILLNLINRLSTWFESVDWDSVASKIGDMLKPIEDYIANIDFETFLDKILDGVQSFLDVAPDVVNFILNLITNLPTVITWIKRLTPVIVGVYGAMKVLATVGDTLTKGNIVGIILTIIGTLATLWATNEDFRNAVTAIWNGIVQTFQELFQGFQELGAAFVELGKATWDGIVAIFSVAVEFFSTLATTVWTTIQTVFSTVVEFFQNIWNGIVTVFSVVVEHFTNLVTTVWTTITTSLSVVGDFFAGIWTGITTAFSNCVNFFSSVFSQAWQAVQNAFSGFVGFFSGLWGSISSTFSALGTTIGNAIGGAVRAGINGVISSIESIINSVISLINGAISLINLIPGVSIGTIGGLSLPRLEKGGILEKGQVGLLEGNGAEAVVPLDQNKAWIKSVASEMQNATSGAQQSGEINNEVTINVYGSDGQDVNELADLIMKKMQLAVNKKGAVYA